METPPLNSITPPAFRVSDAALDRWERVAPNRTVAELLDEVVAGREVSMEDYEEAFGPPPPHALGSRYFLINNGKWLVAVRSGVVRTLFDVSAARRRILLDQPSPVLPESVEPETEETPKPNLPAPLPTSPEELRALLSDVLRQQATWEGRRKSLTHFQLAIRDIKEHLRDLAARQPPRDSKQRTREAGHALLDLITALRAGQTPSDTEATIEHAMRVFGVPAPRDL